jgi:hypothetical protein
MVVSDWVRKERIFKRGVEGKRRIRKGELVGNEGN